MSALLVTYRQDLFEVNQESGYIHAHLLVDADRPVLQLEIDHMRLPIYLDAQNLSLLISRLVEREEQLEVIQAKIKTDGDRWQR